MAVVDLILVDLTLYIGFAHVVGRTWMSSYNLFPVQFRMIRVTSDAETNQRMTFQALSCLSRTCTYACHQTKNFIVVPHDTMQTIRFLNNCAITSTSVKRLSSASFCANMSECAFVHANNFPSIPFLQKYVGVDRQFREIAASPAVVKVE